MKINRLKPEAFNLLVQEGKTMQEISKNLNVSMPTLHKFILENKRQIPKMPISNYERKRNIKVKKMLELSKEGKSILEIANAMGCTRQNIYETIKKSKITLNDVSIKETMEEKIAKIKEIQEEKQYGSIADFCKGENTYSDLVRKAQIDFKRYRLSKGQRSLLDLIKNKGKITVSDAKNYGIKHMTFYDAFAKLEKKGLVYKTHRNTYCLKDF